MGLPNVQVTNVSLMAQVLQWHEKGLDFADALHLALSQNFSAIYTFDTKGLAEKQNTNQAETIMISHLGKYSERFQKGVYCSNSLGETLIAFS